MNAQVAGDFSVDELLAAPANFGYPCTISVIPKPKRRINRAQSRGVYDCIIRMFSPLGLDMPKLPGTYSGT